MLPINNLQDIAILLKNTKNIAIVGLSTKKERASNMVGRYLLDAGYTIIPVNPGQDEILGQRCFPRLKDIKEKIDVVDIFRKSEDVLPIVQEAIDIGAKSIWTQLGIVNDEAAELARNAGLTVIMDRCIKVDHANMV